MLLRVLHITEHYFKGSRKKADKALEYFCSESYMQRKYFLCHWPTTDRGCNGFSSTGHCDKINDKAQRRIMLIKHAGIG